MTKHIAFLIGFLFAFIFCQCQTSQDEHENGRDYPSRDTYRQIDVCMGYMNNDPQRALLMLDSLRAEGLMTQARCDYFHAMVIFSGKKNLDSALVICDQLLNKGKFGDDRFLEEEICVLASNITQSAHRPLETLKYANRGIAICHGDEKMRSDEVLLMSRVGVAERDLGHIDNAIETFSRAHSLLKSTESFADLIALISLQFKQAGLYKQSKEYDKAIAIYHEILDLVERFDLDPSFVGQRPENMQESGDGTHDFANFYKCQIYGHLARIYLNKIEKGLSLDPKADKDSVSLYYDKWLHTEGSQSPDHQASMLSEMLFLGKKSDFDHAKPIAKDFYGSDSLSSNYVDYLTLLAKEEASTNNYKACSNYLQRALVVSDSIRQREVMQELSKQMSINMVQEQQLARQDTENLLERQKLINVLLSIVLGIFFITALIIFLLVRKNLEKQHIIEMTQQDLNESKEDIIKLAQKLEETKTERAVLNSKQIYQRIETAMSEEKLYLDPDLDIIKLSEAVFSSRSVVSSCINSNTGKSFRTWLAEYRLSRFVKMLHEASESVSINDLVQQCGYKDHSTFRRQFKAAYGMSASEYREQEIYKNKETNNERRQNDEQDI